MPPADAKASFSRHYRIKSSLQIQEIVAGRRSVFVHPIKCYYRVVESSATVDSSVAVVVPKRLFPRAVDRNRLKRLMREAFRTHKYQFPDEHAFGLQMQMCWIYVGKELTDFESVCQTVIQLNQKLQKVL